MKCKIDFSRRLPARQCTAVSNDRSTGRLRINWSAEWQMSKLLSNVHVFRALVSNGLLQRFNKQHRFALSFDCLIQSVWYLIDATRRCYVMDERRSLDKNSKPTQRIVQRFSDGQKSLVYCYDGR